MPYKDKDKARAATKKRREKRTDDNFRKLIRILYETPCVFCGDSDVLQLDFNHVRGKKLGGVMRLAKTKPWAIVAAEVAKCEVRCLKCHRTHHSAPHWRRVRFLKEIQAQEKLAMI